MPKDPPLYVAASQRDGSILQPELVSAEEALRQSQKMEAIGQLTGGIAHDFNNLLTGIIGSLDLMQRRLSEGRTEDVQRLATAAMTSANRAAALTHRLLTFSRRQPAAPKVVELNRLVASIDDLLRRTISEAIELELVLPPGVWRVQCDANQMESAILNLAINARDAMPSGGHLQIATGNVTLDPVEAGRLNVPEGQYVSVAVRDTGLGMPAEVAARAFEPFFTTKPLGAGTGLGLPMIYSFARQSGGSVTIGSKAGEGTEITILVPRCAGETPGGVESQAAERRPPLAGEGRVVLIVEDEKSVRSLLMEVLQEHGYRGMSATDGVAGLEILHSEAHVDLLITDVGLPGIDGVQLAEQALTRRPDLKVLFMTGHAPDAPLQLGLEGGESVVILKPFTIDTLLDRVRWTLGSARAAS